MAYHPRELVWNSNHQHWSRTNIFHRVVKRILFSFLLLYFSNFPFRNNNWLDNFALEAVRIVLKNYDSESYNIEIYCRITICYLSSITFSMDKAKNASYKNAYNKDVVETETPREIYLTYKSRNLSIYIHVLIVATSNFFYFTVYNTYSRLRIIGAFICEKCVINI